MNAQFSRLLPREEAIELLSVAPGVQLVEKGDGHPTPLEAAGIDPVLVGRVREDPSQARTLDLWITGDNNCTNSLLSQSLMSAKAALPGNDHVVVAFGQFLYSNWLQQTLRSCPIRSDARLDTRQRPAFQAARSSVTSTPMS